MYKVAVIGDWDSIYGFGALGLDTFKADADDHDKAARLLEKLADNEYAIIYMTEEIASILHDEIEVYRDKPSPAIILIPGISGNTGEGMAAVKRSVEQAVGSDIIFGNND